MAAVLSFALLSVSVFVTSFISGILGMAGGMILMGILLALPGVTLPTAMMLHGITQLASNAWRAVIWRRDVDFRIFRGYALGAFSALAIFAVVHLVVSKPVALINASPRAEHAPAQLRLVLTTMSARVIEPACVTLPLLGKSMSAAEIAADERLAQSLRTVLAALGEAARA